MTMTNGITATFYLKVYNSTAKEPEKGCAMLLIHSEDEMMYVMVPYDDYLDLTTLIPEEGSLLKAYKKYLSNKTAKKWADEYPVRAW